MTAAIREFMSVSWSQVKTFQRCPKMWSYKYVDRLQPKDRKKAPYLGNWIHRSLETFYIDGDWKKGHREYIAKYNKLSLEEQEAISRGRKKKGGWTPLPEQAERIIRSYLWYWRHDGWKVLAVEWEFEVEIGRFTDGNRVIIVMANGKIDLIIEDEEDESRWVVDHKSTGSIPDKSSYHGMDPQLMLYPVGVKKDPKLGYDVAGVIYNYVLSKPPTVPQLTKKTGQISKRKVLTDYLTAKRFLKDNGYDPADFTDFLAPLRKRSPFLERYRMPRESHVTKKILRDFVATAKEIHREKRKKEHVRNITKDCATMCDFFELCRGELNGFDMSHLRKVNYTLREKKDVGDPTSI